MNKVTLALISFLFCASLMAQTGKMYQSNAGKIVYEYEIGNTKSTYTLAFKDYGAKQLIDIKNHNNESEHVKTIIDDQFMMVVNYEDKQVLKIPIEAEDAGMQTGAGMNLADLVQDVMAQEANISGTEKVLDKNCNVYNYSDEDGNKGKYWIWNGYLLKADFIAEDGEHAFMIVKELKIDAEISDDEFKYPTDFEINDMSKMMEQMKMMQQMYGVPE